MSIEMGATPITEKVATWAQKDAPWRGENHLLDLPIRRAVRRVRPAPAVGVWVSSGLLSWS